MTSFRNIFAIIILVMSWISFCIGIYFGVNNKQINMSPENNFVNTITVSLLLLLISLTIIISNKETKKEETKTG